MTITAKFPGICRKCRQPIAQGETIEWEAGKGASHSSCPAVSVSVPKTPAALTIQPAKLFRMFGVAREHLKYPKVHIHNSDVPMFLYVAGERSSTPGALQVIRQSDKEWLGRINLDGAVDLSKKLSPKLKSQVVELLEAFAADPAGYATLHGQQTGHCCFCGRGLEDYRSVSMGYGPTCAGNFGMPWGVVDKSALAGNLAGVEQMAFAS